MQHLWAREPGPGYLQALNDLAHKHGALVIYDEIVTGFRLAMGGAQEYFGVTPDLATFAKAMANGMPLAAVVGSKEVMKTAENCLISITYGGEALSLAAAVATMNILREQNVQEATSPVRRIAQGRYQRCGGTCRCGTRSIRSGANLR